MRTYVVLNIILLTILNSCSINNSSEQNAESKFYSFPSYKDTTQVQGVKNYSVMEMQMARIGINKIDTLDFINQTINLNEIHYTDEYLDYGSNKKNYLKNELTDKTLKILIDTSYRIISYKYHSGLMENISKIDFEEEFESNGSIDEEIDFEKERNDFLRDSTNFIHFYPVFLINNSDSVIAFTYQIISGLISIQEAQDSSGVWRPVEYWHWDWCGNTYSQCDLKPNYYVFSQIKIYNGKFQTNLRLKLKLQNKYYYSEPFKGSINYSQFKVPEKILNSDRKDIMLLE
jgi:hypothetical protein